MRNSAILLVALSTFGRTAQSQAPAATAQNWVDRVQAVRSLVSETPQWSPDGTRLLFASSGGLATIPATGGAIQKVATSTGGAGHFLQTGQPSWSPDGKWVSVISDYAGQPEIWLWSVADQKAKRLTSLGSRISSYSWSPDGRWIALTGGRYGSYDIWKVAVPSGEATRLTKDARPEVFPTWTPDSRKIIYARLDMRWMDHDLFEINATDGSSPRLILSDTDFFDYREGSAFGASPISSDGRTVMFRSQRSGWINFWLQPLAGGAARPVAAEQAEQVEAEWSPDGKSIGYVAINNGTNSLRVAPAAGGASRVLVNPTVGTVTNIAWSPDGKQLSYTFQTPTRPADVYVVPVEGGQPKQLTFSDPDGVEKQLLTPEKVTYKTFDGRTINAYLYRPRNLRAGERVPAIVLAHGGPTSHFADTYQLHAQFFTEQGYVMLLPNIRGSSGYGREFEKLNNGDWGHGDLKDIVAGVDYLKTLPYVNAGKIGMEGTSYGGFITAAAEVWAPEVFQAIVSISGYPDRVKLLDEAEYQHIQQLAYEFGPFEQNKDVYYRNSPFYHVKNATAPLFAIWGEGHFPESQQTYLFAKELERYYKTVKYKAYQGETFYIRTQANTKQMLLDMLGFFDQYLKDSVVAPPQLESRR